MADGSAALKGFMERVRSPIFEHVPVPTFMVLLGEANQDQDHQSHCGA